MVYKVCEFKGTPRIKISEEHSKTTIAGSKSILRAYDHSTPIYDILCLSSEVSELLAKPELTKTVYDGLEKKEVEGVHTNLKLISQTLFENGKPTPNTTELTLKEK